MNFVRSFQNIFSLHIIILCTATPCRARHMHTTLSSVLQKSCFSLCYPSGYIIEVCSCQETEDSLRTLCTTVNNNDHTSACSCTIPQGECEVCKMKVSNTC